MTAARRLERSVDDLSKAEIAKGSPAIQLWVGRLTRIPELAGLEPGRPLAEVPASVRIRCFEQLAQSADEGAAAARGRRRGPTQTAGGRDGLMGRFVDFVDARQRLPRAAPALDVDLTGLLAAYGHAARRASRAERYDGDRDRAA